MTLDFVDPLGALYFLQNETAFFPFAFFTAATCLALQLFAGVAFFVVVVFFAVVLLAVVCLTVVVCAYDKLCTTVTLLDELGIGALEGWVVSVDGGDGIELAGASLPCSEDESATPVLALLSASTVLEVDGVVLTGIEEYVFDVGATEGAVVPELDTAALALFGQPRGVPIGYCDVADATKFRDEGTFLDAIGPGFGKPMLVRSLDAQPEGRSEAARLATNNWGMLCI